tara:strand:- start:711 stop:1769 length:1059 start_codon:yes stop_codon:yes gene_type:complete
MKKFIHLFALLLLSTVLCYAQNPYEKIDSIIQVMHKKNPEIGFSIGIIQNNQEYYSSYGTLDKESDIKINKNSVFEIASITKLVTANLLAQAVLENKIELDDYIDAYLPEHYKLNDAIKHKIKISDLASHQSGLDDVDFGTLIAKNPQQPITELSQDDLTALVNNCNQLKDYGTYRYSTIGYVLLGDILEKSYGKSYNTIVHEKLITPYQLTNTFTKDFNVPNLTSSYNPDGGKQEFFEWHTAASAGLIKSSSSDMVTFLKAILNTETNVGIAAQLCEKIYYQNGDRIIGLGTNISQDGSQILYLKTGDTLGQSSILCYNREKNWGVIILLDHWNPKMRMDILNMISKALMK